MKKYLFLALAYLIFSANACEKKSHEPASDPKHETTGDPNPTIKKTANRIAPATDPKHEMPADPNPTIKK